ncbi:pollen-specific leucine-rich repeat extensin-like protein 4 [Iris pallida]|uniref:Pollen-specific leucine-rich repeat extensin-like protein 4 n=1 Tax=Iris pallida TaxID=29817 RepID=A0AAX6GDC0_IRIPA|nr:pollen-specific leucine-rich repeat extensin-like protein 4 [Iris pallida]KAJ6826228.1 pollen-specific leucine-rich repeat extensin-like protein 4 [Iris pallida]
MREAPACDLHRIWTPGALRVTLPCAAPGLAKTAPPRRGHHPRSDLPAEPLGLAEHGNPVLCPPRRCRLRVPRASRPSASSAGRASSSVTVLSRRVRPPQICVALSSLRDSASRHRRTRRESPTIPGLHVVKTSSTTSWTSEGGSRGLAAITLSTGKTWVC